MPIVTADIYDRYHDDLDVCDVQFRNFGLRKTFSGRCRTIKVYEDHVRIREMLTENGAGGVLVIDGGGSLRIGIVGDKMSAMAVKNGWVGIVCYGAIRDSGEIDRLDLGVKALGTTARRAWDKVDALRGAPIHFGGARFRDGDWIYADPDSVLVSRKELSIEF